MVFLVSFAATPAAIHAILQLPWGQPCFSPFPTLERNQDLRSLCFSPAAFTSLFQCPRLPISPVSLLLHSSPTTTAHPPQLIHLTLLLPTQLSPLPCLPGCLRFCFPPGFPPSSPRCPHRRERTNFQVWSVSRSPHFIWSLIAFIRSHVWFPTESMSLRVASSSQQGFLCF